MIPYLNNRIIRFTTSAAVSPLNSGEKARLSFIGHPIGENYPPLEESKRWAASVLGHAKQGNDVAGRTREIVNFF